MRGIYTAAFLEWLLSQQAARSSSPQLDLGLGFDLIVGTSTGANVRTTAAVGVPMREFVALSENNGPQIFRHRITGKRSAVSRALSGGYFVGEATPHCVEP